jgi:uncharacterized protein DUF6590
VTTCLLCVSSIIQPRKDLTLFSAIHTYQNQGTTARHVRARDHVVIYSGEQPPDLVTGEDLVILNRQPIKVRLDPKGEALLPTARLNLSKTYTVEHNTPAFPVGKISSRDVENIKKYFSEVQGLSIPRDKPYILNVSDDEEDDDDDDDDDDD